MILRRGASGALMQSMASSVAQNVGAGLSIQPGASLTVIGLAAPCATVFGIAINLIYFVKVSQDMKKRTSFSR